jgi:hypothetical protein
LDFFDWQEIVIQAMLEFLTENHHPVGEFLIHYVFPVSTPQTVGNFFDPLIALALVSAKSPGKLFSSLLNIDSWPRFRFAPCFVENAFQFDAPVS